MEHNWIKDEEFFYGCVRWIILVIALICLLIMVFVPTVLYLYNSEKYPMSRLTTLVINCMGVASLLLAVHSLTETRGSGKEIHDVTNKLEGLTAFYEENALRTMDKLNDLDREQRRISSILRKAMTSSVTAVNNAWEDEVPGTADPSDSSTPLHA